MKPAQFVILHHTRLLKEHWDVMLEQDDVLLTWQLAYNPINTAFDSIGAHRINDHRKVYLDYEGPISGGRGEVSRVDAGDVIFLTQSAGFILISLTGDQLRGQFQIKHICENDWEWSAVT